MKHFKVLVLIVSTILLTGCYTQLQYSKNVQQTADEKKEHTSGYSWTDDDNNDRTKSGEKQNAEAVKDQQLRPDEFSTAYKDYEYARKWEECDCNPYKVYNFYSSFYNSYGYGYYAYNPHRSYLSISPFSYSLGFSSFHGLRPYYGSRFSFRNPYNSYFHDPFYGYGYGGYRLDHPYYGTGLYHDGDEQDVNRNSRYGSRSIGTDRVNVNRSRSGDGTRARGQRSTVTTDGGAVRSRSSVGTSRTKNDNTVRSRSSSENNNRGTVRNRGDYNDEDDRSSRGIRHRSVSDSGLNDIDTQRQRSRSFRNVATDDQGSQRRTFFNRLKGFFKSSTQSLTGSNGTRSTFGSSTRSRSGSSSKTTTRNRSSVGSNTSSRSSVGSRSSSGNTRSQGSSSRSRSRSGGNDGGSSSSDRSRDD